MTWQLQVRRAHKQTNKQINIQARVTNGHADAHSHAGALTMYTEHVRPRRLRRIRHCAAAASLLWRTKAKA